MGIILVFFAVWFSAIAMVRKVFRESANMPVVPRALSRAAICTAAFGVGIIGGEGFALPGPLVGALMFYNGAYYYPYTALLPAAAEFTLFFALFTLAGISSDRRTIKSDGGGAGKPVVARDWASVADAVEEALLSFRAGRPMKSSCPACRTALVVETAEPKPGGNPEALRITCECGRCNGVYEFTGRKGEREQAEA